MHLKGPAGQTGKTERMMELPEALEVKKNNEEKYVAIYIAVLAVMLAICSAGGGNASKTVMTSSIEVTDTWAFYQARNIRQQGLRLAADDLEIRLQQPNLPDTLKKAMQDKITSYRATADRYESDTKNNDGKKELMEKARKLEADRDTALRQDPYFDFSEGMLQIAIVLASSSLILGSRALLLGSFGVGGLGILFLINAFTLLVKVPFMG
jgi:hypothetical protein